MTLGTILLIIVILLLIGALGAQQVIGLRTERLSVLLLIVIILLQMVRE